MRRFVNRGFSALRFRSGRLRLAFLGEAGSSPQGSREHSCSLDGQAPRSCHRTGRLSPSTPESLAHLGWRRRHSRLIRSCRHALTSVEGRHYRRRTEAVSPPDRPLPRIWAPRRPFCRETHCRTSQWAFLETPHRELQTISTLNMPTRSRRSAKNAAGRQRLGHNLTLCGGPRAPC